MEQFPLCVHSPPEGDEHQSWREEERFVPAEVCLGLPFAPESTIPCQHLCVSRSRLEWWVASCTHEWRSRPSLYFELFAAIPLP